MADYKLNYTAEEVDALLARVKSGAVLPVVQLITEFDFSTPGPFQLHTDDIAKLQAINAFAFICAFVNEDGFTFMPIFNTLFTPDGTVYSALIWNEFVATGFGITIFPYDGSAIITPH